MDEKLVTAMNYIFNALGRSTDRFIPLDSDKTEVLIGRVHIMSSSIFLNQEKETGLLATGESRRRDGYSATDREKLSTGFNLVLSKYLMSLVDISYDFEAVILYDDLGYEYIKDYNVDMDLLQDVALDAIQFMEQRGIVDPVVIGGGIITTNMLAEYVLGEGLFKERVLHKGAGIKIPRTRKLSMIEKLAA